MQAAGGPVVAVGRLDRAHIPRAYSIVNPCIDTDGIGKSYDAPQCSCELAHAR